MATKKHPNRGGLTREQRANQQHVDLPRGVEELAGIAFTDFQLQKLNTRPEPFLMATPCDSCTAEQCSTLCYGKPKVLQAT